MDKKELKHPKAERHEEVKTACNCGPECTCGCQEGKECHCNDGCHCCHCGCGCGCPCQKKAAKLLGAILIFALGFFSAKVIGCKPCMMGHKPCPKMSMQAPHFPNYAGGNGDTIIIINTDGKPDVQHFLGGHHGKKPHFFHDKHKKHHKHDIAGNIGNAPKNPQQDDPAE